MKLTRLLILILILVITLIIVGFVSPGTGNTPQEGSIKKVLADFAKDESLQSASWGFYALDTRTGREIISHNPDLALIPASTQKAITTLTSLSILGSDYRYQTLLQCDGPIVNGVLKGNIYITGTGDPTLGSTMMADSLALRNVFLYWLNDLNASGITKVEGNIIADASWFDDHMIPAKWIWEDIGNYYGAGAHALTVNENMYTVFFEPGIMEGATAQVIRTEPVVPDMVFHNDVTTGPRGSGDRVYIYGSPYSPQRWLTGTVPLGESNFAVKGSLHDPGMFLAYALQTFLKENNIEVNGTARTHRNMPEKTMPDARITLSRWLSPPMEDIAARTNFSSVNTYAENLVKTLGRHVKDEGSFAAGTQAVVEFWEEMGIDTRGMRMHDGSGLSPYNNVTVKQLTQMLYFASRNEALYQSLVKGLPIAGRNGSLKGMFASTPSAGVLAAKSGFLGNVRSYTGYTRCNDGHLIAFTIIINNYSGSALEMRRKMEVVMNALTGMKL
ncbi:MAG: D-alanyl-D-alanine carboxypeptidase/D-alanyl-D-alanine-endopeptidase [Bacteroidota bacterium]